MATAVAAPPITVEQYLGFEGYPGLKDELINGRIVLSPQPKPHHQQVVKNIFMLLLKAFEGSAFEVQMNSNIKFAAANSMPAPDIFVVTRGAWRGAIQGDVYLEEPPLIVVEVLSQSNRKGRVEEKAAIYLENGVSHVWTASPKHRRLCTHRVESGNVVEEQVDRITVSGPVAFSISADDVFRLD